MRSVLWFRHNLKVSLHRKKLRVLSLFVRQLKLLFPALSHPRIRPSHAFEQPPEEGRIFVADSPADLVDRVKKDRVWSRRAPLPFLSRRPAANQIEKKWVDLLWILGRFLCERARRLVEGKRRQIVHPDRIEDAIKMVAFML
jgi:hypothetical protein